MGILIRIMQKLVVNVRINWLRLLVQGLSIRFLFGHLPAHSVQHTHKRVNDVEFLHDIFDLPNNKA